MKITSEKDKSYFIVAEALPFQKKWNCTCDGQIFRSLSYMPSLRHDVWSKVVHTYICIYMHIYDYGYTENILPRNFLM